ncbi:MAG: hypothetical protein QFX31_00505 [Methanothrix sp.]|uniref:hypothetical protein n=1 Tax=Methanothrix sp. TaxID=90426 RepID=UPI0032B006E3|nr:hypothetical protein [Methanothrix sp.]
MSEDSDLYRDLVNLIREMDSKMLTSGHVTGRVRGPCFSVLRYRISIHSLDSCIR